MPSPPDVAPNDLITSVWGNTIRDQSWQPFVDSAQRDGSIPLPVAGAGYAHLTADLQDPVAGSLSVYFPDTVTPPTTPAGVPGWVRVPRGDWAVIDANIELKGDHATPGLGVWINYSGAGNLRWQGRGFGDGAGDETMLQIASSLGGSSWIRVPTGAGGSFQLRKRTGGAGASVISRWDVDALAIRLGHPEVFGGSQEGWRVFVEAPSGSSPGLVARSSASASLAITDPDGDSNTDSVLWVPGNITTSSDRWAWPAATWPLDNGRTAYRLDRFSGSSKRWKTKLRRARALRGELAPKVRALRPAEFKYRDGYLAEDDERVGATMLGLIAEDVAEIEPGWVDHDAEGLPAQISWPQVTTALLALVLDMADRLDALESS